MESASRKKCRFINSSAIKSSLKFLKNLDLKWLIKVENSKICAPHNLMSISGNMSTNITIFYLNFLVEISAFPLSTTITKINHAQIIPLEV